MAEITITFRRDAKTGKKEIVIHLEGEADLLPHEHERDHKALVEKLIGRKLVDDDGEVVVERVGKDGRKIGVLEGDRSTESAGQRGTEKNRG